MNVLKMIFENENSGKTLTWSLKNANMSATSASVGAAMNQAIEVITVDSSEPNDDVVQIKDAYFYTTQKIELE